MTKYILFTGMRGTSFKSSSSNAADFIERDRHYCVLWDVIIASNGELIFNCKIWFSNGIIQMIQISTTYKVHSLRLPKEATCHSKNSWSCNVLSPKIVGYAKVSKALESQGCRVE